MPTPARHKVGMEAEAARGPPGVGVLSRSSVNTQALDNHPCSGELLHADPPPRCEAPRGRIILTQLARARAAIQSLRLFAEGWCQGTKDGYDKGWSEGWRRGYDSAKQTTTTRSTECPSTSNAEPKRQRTDD